MSPEDFITSAHLDAVRGEMHARIDQHKAEVDGALNTLSAKFDAWRSAQEVDSIALRGALERLTDEVSKTATAVDKLEDGAETSAAITAALAQFKGSISRRFYTVAGLLVAVAGVVIAALQ